MTPKQLLEAHGGDPLAAADALINKESTVDVGKGTRMESSLEGFIASGSTGLLWAFVEYVIAHLCEDGAEKWGAALLGILGFADRWWELRHSAVTRIANATDRERLAACLVALAEVEWRGRSEGDSPKTRVLKMRPDLGCEAVYYQGQIAGYRVFDRADKTIASERSAWEAWRTAELVVRSSALAEGEGK